MADQMADILALHAATQPAKLAIVDDRPDRPTVTSPTRSPRRTSVRTSTRLSSSSSVSGTRRKSSGAGRTLPVRFS